MLCLEGNTFEFILLDVCLASWMCPCIFITFEYFLIILSSDFLSVRFFSTSLSGIFLMYMLVTWWCLIGLWGHVHFSTFFFLCIPQTNSFCIPKIINQTRSSLVCLQACWLFLLVVHKSLVKWNFYFSYYAFSTQEFQFVHFVCLFFSGGGVAKGEGERESQVGLRCWDPAHIGLDL